MELSVLRYRPWKGDPHGPIWSPLPIARAGLIVIFRRKLFWALYLFALLNFMIFFSGIYLLTQVEAVSSSFSNPRSRGFAVLVGEMVKWLKRNRDVLGENPATFANFFWYQGWIVTAVLALAGSMIIGNDYQHGSLSFYLSKPLRRRHYLAGKLLIVGLFVNLMTTVPALVLFVECGLVADGPYFGERLHLVAGILGYGLVLTVVLSLLVVATATALRKTIPMIMVWVALLIFGRVLANVLVDRMFLDHHWRLIDLWNDMYILGCWCLDTPARLYRWQGGQPEAWAAALVLVGVCAACVIYLSRRIRAVEVVE